MRLAEFNVNTLAKNWGVDIPDIATENVLGAYGDYVYVQGESEGTIQKRKRTDGSLVWEKDFALDLDAGKLPNIAVDNQYNIYTVYNRYLYKYNDSGSLLWSSEIDANAMVPNTVLAVSKDGNYIAVYGISQRYAVIFNSDGTIKLTIDIDSGGSGYLIGFLRFDSENNIIASTDYDQYGNEIVKKFLISDGSKLWEKGRFMANIDINDNVWCISHVGNLEKLGKNTGNILATSNESDYNNVQDIQGLSNGDMLVVMYDGGTDTITLRRVDQNTNILASQDYTNITSFSRTIKVD